MTATAVAPLAGGDAARYAALALLVGAIIASAVLGWEAKGVALVGAAPAGLPAVHSLKA